MEHSPTPYHVKPAGTFSPPLVYDAKGILVCQTSDTIDQPAQSNAEFICRACNNFDNMLRTIALFMEAHEPNYMGAAADDRHRTLYDEAMDSARFTLSEMKAKS